MAFLLIVAGREAKSTDGTIVGHDGGRYWVCIEPDGWVEATSSRFTERVERGKVFVTDGAQALGRHGLVQGHGDPKWWR